MSSGSLGRTGRLVDLSVVEADRRNWIGCELLHSIEQGLRLKALISAAQRDEGYNNN